ncbi:YadA C-terminal domain-containing protein [Proteus appendicitidis]|uniref:YadA C-terminal domain-containing protein n=1 Tax=Proteus appendicitidis TaxID=3034648 RepID=A0ABY8Y600_9GAMM|nr:YadA C-terminal domain-containing protein [Proteus sp. HZ0627]WIV87683.1 YadA C-terminal domain-containing protein [Proteus sp. HZ0627]
MKYKNIFIATISIIYSSCVFSNTLNPNVSSDLITPEYEELENKKSYLTSTIFNQIVDSNLINIVKGINKDKEAYGIELNSSVAKDLEKYLRSRNLTDSADLIKKNIVNKNGYIDIQSNNSDLKMGIVGYLLEKDLLTEKNRNEVINLIKHAETMIYSTQDSALTLDDLESPERLHKIVDNLNTKNRSLLLLEKNTKQDLAQMSQLQEQDYSLLKNLVSDNKKRLSEDLQNNSEKIKNNESIIKKNTTNLDKNNNLIEKNTTDIEKNTHAINSNASNIRENRDDISDIKENYIDNLNINGSNISLKSHFATLYTEQSVSRNEFKTLKSDFEYFKSDTQNRFYKVEKRANQGIASVAAMSNLPFTDNATFSTAIGIGNYRNATALAWGMQYRINENIKVRASTAWNETNSWVSAGGVGISW